MNENETTKMFRLEWSNFIDRLVVFGSTFASIWNMQWGTETIRIMNKNLIPTAIVHPINVEYIMSDYIKTLPSVSNALELSFQSDSKLQNEYIFLGT